MKRTPPKEMATKLARQIRSQQPDYQYLKYVFHHIRTILDVAPTSKAKRLPELLTDQELTAFYDAVFSARNRKHAVMIKLLIFTGVRNEGIRRIGVMIHAKEIRLSPNQIGINNVFAIEQHVFPLNRTDMLKQ